MSYGLLPPIKTLSLPFNPENWPLPFWAAGDERGPAELPGDPGARMTPAVRRLLREHGLEAAMIVGTGGRGRITREDVTDAVDELLPTVEDHLDRMQDVLRLGACPQVAIGPHCDSPYTCPLRDHCWSHLPEHSVFTLVRIGAKAFKLYEQGVVGIRHLPAGVKLTPKQEIQRQAVVNGRPHIYRPALATFLRRINYPLHFLDFETFAPAIPMFDGDGPFELIPFQFSLHVQPAPGAEPKHAMFLAEGTGDPRRAFLERLRAALGDRGSVVVYHAPFERGVLNRCAERMPEFEPWVNSVKRRVIDLLTPCKSFRVYYPQQRGSGSIKAVMPHPWALRGRPRPTGFSAACRSRDVHSY